MLDIMLRSLCVWLFCVTQPLEGDNAAVSCGDFMQDWYPSVKPQSSVAPYALSISDKNGYFRQWSRRSPTYGSKTVQIGSYHSICARVFSTALLISFMHASWFMITACFRGTPVEWYASRVQSDIIVVGVRNRINIIKCGTFPTI